MDTNKMDKKQMDQLMEQKVQPLTPAKRQLPLWAMVGGTILLYLTLGMQQAITDNPDQYSSWIDTKNLTMILGGLAGLLGPYFALQNNKTSENALIEAAKAPPIGPDGERSARNTMIAALKQAAIEAEDEGDGSEDLVHGITALLYPPKPTTSEQSGPNPAPTGGA